MVKVIKLIYSDECTFGSGTPDDPVRIISKLWTMDGECVAEHDCHTKKSLWDGKMPEGEPE